jgi:nitrate/nitrite-specific signal transduction histidine kinase
MQSIDEALAIRDTVSATDEERADLATIREYQATLSSNFEETLTAASEGGDPIALVEEMSDDELAINAEMDQIILIAGDNLNAANRDVNEFRNIALAVSITVLVLFPLLAVWAFFLSSRFTEPMLQIDNAVMAAGGKTYREALLAGTVRRRDGIGDLAKTVDRMAQTLCAENDRLEQEVAAARQQLTEARRRRLSQN